MQKSCSAELASLVTIPTQLSSSPGGPGIRRSLSLPTFVMFVPFLQVLLRRAVDRRPRRRSEACGELDSRPHPPKDAPPARTLRSGDGHLDHSQRGDLLEPVRNMGISMRSSADRNALRHWLADSWQEPVLKIPLSYPWRVSGYVCALCLFIGGRCAHQTFRGVMRATCR